jgi:hypothetical protein
VSIRASSATSAAAGRSAVISLCASNPVGVSGAAISTSGGWDRSSRVPWSGSGSPPPRLLTWFGAAHGQPAGVAAVLHGLGDGVEPHRSPGPLQRLHQVGVHPEGAEPAVAVAGLPHGGRVRQTRRLCVGAGGLRLPDDARGGPRWWWRQVGQYNRNLGRCRGPAADRHLLVRLQQDMNGTGEWTLQLRVCHRAADGHVTRVYVEKDDACTALACIYALARRLGPLPDRCTGSVELGRWEVRTCDLSEPDRRQLARFR